MCFTNLHTSLSEYKDLATISSSIRVSAWNSFFSESPFKVSACLCSVLACFSSVSTCLSSGAAAVASVLYCLIVFELPENIILIYQHHGFTDIAINLKHVKSIPYLIV